MSFRHVPDNPRKRAAFDEVNAHLFEACRLWIRHINGQDVEGSVELHEILDDCWNVVYHTDFRVDGENLE